MGRQVALMAVSENVGDKRYRFYLQSPSKGLLRLTSAPEGWNGAKYALKRNEKYFGLFRSISYNDLSFVKEARDYLSWCYIYEGINANCTFTVQRLSNAGSYEDYFTGKLDFSTFKIDELSVRCSIVDSSFAEKVKNRENIKVDVFNTISTNGAGLGQFNDAIRGRENTWRLRIPAFSIWRQVWYYRNEPWVTTSKDHYLPLLLSTFNVFSEAQSQEITATDPLFLSSTADRNLNLWGTIAGTVEMVTTNKTLLLSIYLYVDGAIHYQWDFTGEFVTETLQRITFNFAVDENFTVTTGNDVYLKAVTNATLPPTTDITTTYDVATQLRLSEITAGYPGCNVAAWPVYETILRTVQKISDKVDCFQSDFFGRTDSQIITYAEDGELAHITKGKFIKNNEQYPYTLIYDGKVMEISFNELFSSLSAVYGLGMGIETTAGIERVRVEPIRYFFSDTVIIDLSGRIVESTIGKEVIPDKHYSNIQSGFQSSEYLTTVNIREPNCKSDWSTVISALDNKLDIVSKYRADTNGINLLRSKYGTEEEEKGEQDIFIIDAVRSLSTPYFQARTDEGFDLIDGEYGIEDCYNLAITPGRAVRQWGAMIRAGMENYKGTYLRWQAADKNAELTTQLTGEAVAVVENSNVLVNDLEAPWFIAEFYTFDCVMYIDELETIKDNPKGLIKIAADKYGWIWSLEMEAEENKVSVKLLRANLNVVTPV